MPARQRQPNEIAQQVVPLLLLGIGLVTTNRSVTIIDDEAFDLNLATLPVRQTMARFFHGNAPPYPHPPLFDILLHFWLRWTGGSFEYLRIPSILFFIAGLFLLAQACRHFTGPSGGVAVIWVGVLWPFGFHYGRMAVWYAFSFFLVSGLTLAYLKYLDEGSFVRWTAMFLFCLGLIWTNYFGWALLGCLTIDFLLRKRDAEPAAKVKAFAGTAGLLVLASLPFLHAFRNTLRNSIDAHHSAAAVVANAAFCVYSLFVSESVAPWFWRFSIPAGLATLLCLGLAAWWTPRPVRRFLFYGFFSIAAMALIGILNTKRLLLLSPWILLPVGVAIDTVKPRWATYSLTAGLFVIAAVGWYGIYARHYYSAPRFIEPWQEIAGDAAGQMQSGAIVIADHPSFLFYLTYDLRVPNQSPAWKFQGMVPDPVPYPQVYLPADWLSAGHVTGSKMILIRGGRHSGENDLVDQAQRQLDQACGSISSRLRMRDEGYAWKERFFPQLGEPLWRIEIRNYDCDSSNSKQIFRIPPP